MVILCEFSVFCSMAKFAGSGEFSAPCRGIVMLIGSLRFATLTGFPWQSSKRSPRQLLFTPVDELSQMNGLSLALRPCKKEKFIVALHIIPSEVHPSYKSLIMVKPYTIHIFSIRSNEGLSLETSAFRIPIR